MGREFSCLGQEAWEGFKQQKDRLALHFGKSSQVIEQGETVGRRRENCIGVGCEFYIP